MKTEINKVGNQHLDNRKSNKNKSLSKAARVNEQFNKKSWPVNRQNGLLAT